MFNFVYVVIFVFVDLLFIADITRAMEFNVTSLELGTSGTIPCRHVENITEIRLVQWYKSKRIDAFKNGDPSVAWWNEGKSGSQPNYHMDITTFSLVIEKATLEDEGLYKCSVIREELSTGSNYLTRTVTYALPRMDPKITLDTAFNRVHCTVEHVKPLIYPVLNFDWIPDSTETFVVLNENGTYTTSVCCALPQTKSALKVDCSFSYSNYRRDASLDLRDITTDSPMKYITTTVSPMDTSVTFAGDGCRTIDYTAIIVGKIVVGLLTVANFIMLIMWIKCKGKCHQGVQNFNKAKESEAMVAIRKVYTRGCTMQQHHESTEHTKFHKFLKDVLRNIPNKYPRSYHLEEFGWNDFNKIGSIHPHCHVGNIQLATYQHSPSLDESNDLSFFGRSLTLNFLPAYHDTNFVPRPVRYDSYIAFLGRTSMYVGIDLRDAKSDALYMSSLMQCMAMDVNKRTPVPIGSETIKKYVDKTTLKTPPQRHQFLPLRPDNGDVFRWKTTVQWSDVDYNRHVNQTPYLRFMYDAGSSAAVAGFLRSFHHELIHYKLKTYTVEYMQEIRQGKEVEVVCWEMDDNPGTIHFEVLVGDRTVSRSHLIFDAQPSAKL